MWKYEFILTSCIGILMKGKIRKRLFTTIITPADFGTSTSPVQIRRDRRWADFIGHPMQTYFYVSLNWSLSRRLSDCNNSGCFLLSVQCPLHTLHFPPFSLKMLPAQKNNSQHEIFNCVIFSAVFYFSSLRYKFPCYHLVFKQHYACIWSVIQ